jgi:predicted sulfurtransferase
MEQQERLSFLLYYHYVAIPSPSTLCQWHQEICSKLQLKGRIRISPEGLNGTLGGAPHSIHEYIKEITALEYLHPEQIDWKISSSTDRYPTLEQQFNSLSIKVTKEVVSLDCTEQEREAAIAGDILIFHLESFSCLLILSVSLSLDLSLFVAGSGPHLSPEQFHNEITQYVQAKELNGSSSSPPSSPPLVLLDVRNAYETEIGRFEITAGTGDDVLVPVYDPLTRSVRSLTVSPS